ncbi:MFS transporter [Paraburkholderia silviterrae]|uniref:MFS transporter n=1 Tax=Paraburkholderia silviterrae TaxID=2528715 RepID=A0A4R5LX75_9BURK|nr:MFS transporter [Paraburkholderia silviterrae]TDG16512.1 MFS transporter [Paraburkholderia silviterrae]
MNKENSTRRSQPAFVAAMVALGVFSPTVFMGLPAVVGQVAQRWAFGEATLGIAVFAEVFGMSCGALLVAFVLGRQPVRLVLLAAAVLAAAANLATLGVHGFVAFALLRCVAGMGSGALNGIAMRYLSYTTTPERHLGMLVMGQVLWGMALLAFVIPSLGAAWGAPGVFTFVAALSVPFACVAGWFERGETLSTPQQIAGGRVDKGGALLSLVALFALYGGVGVVWTFLEKIGADAGLSGSYISIVLAAANLVSLAACVLMPKLGVGGGLRRWTLFNLTGCVLAAVSLALPPSPLSFALGSVVFIVCWTGGALLIFATVPQYDLVGRFAALSPGFLALGFGVGSIAGGELMEASGTRAALEAAIALCMFALVFYARLRPVDEGPALVPRCE